MEIGQNCSQMGTGPQSAARGGRASASQDRTQDATETLRWFDALVLSEDGASIGTEQVHRTR
jgi:hypothetical protein